MVRCEKCGKEIDCLMLSVFDRSGADSDYDIPIHEVDEDAVCVEVSPAWTGYELSEEEQMETIRCPHCGKFPFAHQEVQTQTVVQVVCFKSEPYTDEEVEDK